jgi:hypothetical protein
MENFPLTGYKGTLRRERGSNLMIAASRQSHKPLAQNKDFQFRGKYERKKEK